eukprot:TRINITY_DN47833_c0_g1_i1.p1 TRINITY_DN47833_c0_g1~~TRINITY_DN47833_c0_g1_i1.p1  ORF type:complete len:659 (+),score=209.35 TRINITY_DN47833_c0_g1_i1:145-2121(+)
MWGDSLASIPSGVDGSAALRELRKRVSAGGSDGPVAGSPEDLFFYLRSDHFLVRFLVARQWDVDKAAAMLRDHYKWMAEMGLAKLLKDPFPEEVHVKKYYPQAYHGISKQGWPIYIERPGHIDMPRMLQLLAPERLLEYMFVGSELGQRLRNPACSLARGEVIDKSLNIMDLDGLGFRVLTHTTARRVLKDYTVAIQNHYPESMGKLIIVNAPKVFSVAWSFVKPLLDDKTVSKISIYGADKKAWSEALLELADADQLPKFLGGSCVCDGKDPLSCVSAPKRGPWLDPVILKLLDEHPLEKIMTLEGCKMHVNGKAGDAVVDEAKDEALDLAARKPSEDEEEEEARDEFSPMSLPGETLSGLSLQVANAEAEVNSHIEEYAQLEEAHMNTLTAWVQEYNDLVRELGRPVIERAQPYYDGLALWQQLVQEFARQQEEMDNVNRELEVAVKNLSRCEAAFEAFLCGKAENLSEEEWERIAPTRASDLEHEAVAGDPRLIRSLRVSSLADRVTSLQWRRDTAGLDLKAKSKELDEVRGRFEAQQQQHSLCVWNCSVKRAQPFYDKRRLHEASIEAQQAGLQKAEREVQLAREKLAALHFHEHQQQRGADGMPLRPFLKRTYSVDEMSLQSFEIAGGQPGDDEFMSCQGSVGELSDAEDGSP